MLEIKDTKPLLTQIELDVNLGEMKYFYWRTDRTTLGISTFGPRKGM